MRPKNIATEMRPKGKVRSAIRDLAKQSGAYIIVSSKSSVSDLTLGKRREAMATAVKGMTGARALALDFYDRGRVATWVRDNPGLIPWVRQKLGKSIQGWRSYGAWAYTAEDVKATYLLDDMLRIHTGKREGGNGVSTTDGLTSIRDVLREPARQHISARRMQHDRCPMGKFSRGRKKCVSTRALSDHYDFRTAQMQIERVEQRQMSEHIFSGARQ